MRTIQQRQWRNWSGSVICTPERRVQPEKLDEIVAVVREQGDTGRTLRVVGAGHSFTPLVQSNDVLLSLERWQGIEKIDREQMTVRVRGGTTLKRLGEELHQHGLSQQNLGDIDVQSLAGAISTGTHGTGAGYGNLATQVVGLTLVTASGELLECSLERDADLFRAAQIALGTLGIITEVTLRVVPARRLHFQSRRERLVDCLEKLVRYKEEHTHFEFYWFPYTEWVQTKFLDETEAEAKGSTLWGNLNKIVLENGVFWVLSEGSRLLPRFSSTVSKISALGIATVDETDYSQRLFATPRYVRFQEMEYAVPAEQVRPVIEEIQQCIEKQRFAVHFPLECRFVQADDIWLSPAYERETAYIAVHMYRGMPYRSYFQQIEEIFQRHEGRPHWGKMHTQSAASLERLYPRWQDFQQVRAKLDPQGMFFNDYLRDLFGV